MPLAGPPLHSGGPQKLHQLAGVGVPQLRALASVVLLWTPSCILSRMPRSLSKITTGRYLDNDLQVCIIVMLTGPIPAFLLVLFGHRWPLASTSTTHRAHHFHADWKSGMFSSCRHKIVSSCVALSTCATFIGAILSVFVLRCFKRDLFIFLFRLILDALAFSHHQK